MDKLRVGIVGANAEQSWAKYSHVPALKSLSNIQLQAVATRHENSARKACEAFGANLWFADYKELVKSDQIDIVTVSVKVPEHREVVLAALKAGKHVYCEWPLGRNLAETQELAEVAKNSKSHVLIGLQGTFNPAAIHAAKLIKDGAIGKVTSSRLVSTSMGFGPKFPSMYKYFDDPESGANAIIIMGGHAIDLTLALIGPIREIQCMGNIQFPLVTVVDANEEFHRTVADQMFMMFKYQNNSVGSVEITGGRSLDFPFIFEVHGTAGNLTLSGGSLFGFQGGDLNLEVNGKAVEITSAHQADGAALNVAQLYSQFASDIRSKTRTVPDFEHAVRLTQLITSVNEAAKSGSRTHLKG
jgi:predicted dehydrogenase